MYQLISIRHSWPGQANLEVDQSQNDALYTFLHFYDSVELLAGGKIITTNPHACILYTPGIKQFYRSDTPFLYDWLHFKADVSLPDGLQSNTIFYPADHSYITTIIREAEKEFHSHKLYQATLIDIKLQELFIKLSREDHEAQFAAIDQKTRHAFQKLRNEIIMDPSKHHNVSEMAKKLYLSASAFHNIYRALFGKSPMEDLISSRIHNAASELINTNKPISQIAEELGYSNPSHFSRQFRKQTGVNPTAYRKSGLHSPSQNEIQGDYLCSK